MKRDQEKINEAWQMYIAQKTPIPEQADGIRPEVLNSWKRSLEFSDPYATSSALLAKEELRQIFQENTLLVHVAFPYIQKFHRIFCDRHFHILLTDAEGRLLSGFSDHSEKPAENGTIYSEETLGTNSISLCLAENRLIMLTGAEHYRKQFHPFVCCAAPIHNSSAVCVGSLCIRSPIETAPDNLSDFLQFAVSGIENELYLTQYNGLLNAVIDLYEPGILILDYRHKIRRHNLSCERLLQLTQAELDHRTLESVLSSETLSPFLRDLTTEFQTINCTIRNLHDQQLHLKLSAKRFAEPDLPDDAILLMFVAQESAASSPGLLSGLQAKFTFDSMVQESAEMKRVIEIGKLAADSSSNVLIIGESGTGKELLAHAIHNASPRSAGPFVAVNCAFLQKESIEGNHGKFEPAHGGTLFLDEVSSMPLDVQAALLRVLQSREIRHSGEEISKPVDVRIIASTNVDLLTAIQNKTFRNDLYYRLNVLKIRIPPLRERVDDIVPLFEGFVRDYRRKHPTGETFHITKDTLHALKCYHWPGNVRELENFTERTLHLLSGSTLRLSDLPPEIANPQSGTAPFRKNAETLPPDVQEYHALLDAIQQFHGNVKAAGDFLSIPTSTLYRKLRKYEINAKDYLYWK